MSLTIHYTFVDNKKESYDLKKYNNLDILKYRRLIDRNNHYVSDLMKIHFARGKKISYNQFGKPYLANNKGGFNVSHDNQLIVGTESEDSEIGIDTIQLNREVGVQQFQGIFHPNEDKSLETFSKKEAILKMIGTGLSTPMNQIKINTNDSILLNDQYLDCKIFDHYIDEPDSMDKYYISVAIPTTSHHAFRQSSLTYFNIV
jgi:phosphopantetheinyl transferase